MMALYGSPTTGKLINNGIIKPGNGAVGTFTIDGTFTQGSNGVLEVDITPTGNNNDKLFINAGTSTRGWNIACCCW